MYRPQNIDFGFGIKTKIFIVCETKQEKPKVNKQKRLNLKKDMLCQKSKRVQISLRELIKNHFLFQVSNKSKKS